MKRLIRFQLTIFAIVTVVCVGAISAFYLHVPSALGIVASMRLNTNTPVPENVTATVKSVSAIGEQYIDLVPPDHASTTMLRDNSNIAVDHTAIGQDIAGLLTQAEN